MTKMSQAVNPFLTLEEQASAAATPTTGNSRLYVDDGDHLLRSVDDGGNVTSYGDTANPMSAKGEMIVGDTGGAPSALAAGAIGLALVAAGTGNFPAWGTPLGAVQTYTPAWTSDGSAPAVVNGTISGRYRMLDATLMWLLIQFSRGSSDTNGTGNYSFSLPAAYKAKNSGGLRQPGAFHLLDNGTTHYSGTAEINPNATTVQAYVADATGVKQFAHTVPITLATGDVMTFSMMLEVEPV